jgi:hypothetical protein
MFAGELLSQDSLPMHLIDHCVELLYASTSNEKELVRIVVETLIDFRDPLFETVDTERSRVGAFLQSTFQTLNSVLHLQSTTNGSLYSVNYSFSRERSLQRPARVFTEKELFEAEFVDVRCLTVLRAVLERLTSVRQSFCVFPSYA